MINRSLVCVHCGTTLGLETGACPSGMPLIDHLAELHRELLSLGETPMRWAVLLEHFRVVPLRYPASPRVVLA
jgi:hypothetical protein